MSSGGRPLHDYWNSAYFEAVRQFGRIQALCLFCNRRLKNTAKARLKLHRNVCPIRRVATPVPFYKVEPKLEPSPSPKRRKLSRLKLVDLMCEESIEHEQSDTSNEESVEADNNEALEESFHEEYIEEEQQEMQRKPFDFKNENNDHEIGMESTNTISSQPSSSKVDTKTFPSTSLKKKRENIEIDEALAEFFFGCNIPFVVADLPYFKNFVKALNNSYKIPELKHLLSTLLDRVHEKYNNIPKDYLEVETTSVLILSGFNHSNGVIACVQTENETRHFLNFWDFDGEISEVTETTPEELNERLDRVTEILKDCRATAKALFNTKLYAAVFDGLEISTSIGSLWCTTCNSHEASLLAQDIIDLQLIGSVVEILRIFEKPELEAELIQNGGCRIVFPCAGKWCTYKETLNCFSTNYIHIYNILSSRKVEVAEKISDMFFSEEFVNEVRMYSETLESICNLIYTCQKNKATLSEAAEAWLTLKLPEKFNDVLEARKRITLSPCALAANFVDPRYRGKFLSETQIDLIEDFFLEQLSADALDDLFVFKANNGIFKILWEKHITTPMTFWGFAERKHPEFSKLAKKLLRIPASSSQLEQLYSEFSKVHMPVRNMLGLEKLRKLVKTYFNLRLTNSSNN